MLYTRYKSTVLPFKKLKRLLLRIGSKKYLKMWSPI